MALSERERVFLGVSAVTAVVVVCIVGVYFFVVFQNLKADRTSDCVRSAASLTEAAALAPDHVQEAIADCYDL